ncbi:hypothetical protein [Arthrobacter crystallopoietes]|uniref:Uncharacterized protein n=1 Tax=Crystallibacter crystallopoietes TaxID=37928 RepID=A0A1H1GBY3_9MICC|nr:hypothetical protein [Arthrobacter crystallopoietes]AUI52655.1 hypothetical protein AC20117_19460 [Arthrobacter crystallopoietes]SDR10681.1 hypothetical protein SAMN04489742_3985 [Arthrobacter crystallopoietes]
MNVLSLVKQTITFTEVRRRLFFRRETERVRTFLDFAIDGVLLRELALAWDPSMDTDRFSTKLTEDDPHEAVDEIDSLLGRMGLDPDEYQGLLFLPDSQNTTNDGLAAQLSFETDRVVWGNFAWGDASPWLDFDASHRIENAPTFTFDRLQYETVLLEARDHYIRYIAGPSRG